RLREQEEAEQQQARREHPVDHLCVRLHHCSVSARSTRSGRATTSAKITPATITSSGGSVTSHQKPWCIGCSSVKRYGCSSAHRKPAAIVAGPSSEMTCARLLRLVRAAGSERTYVELMSSSVVACRPTTRTAAAGGTRRRARSGAAAAGRRPAAGGGRRRRGTRRAG